VLAALILFTSVFSSKLFPFRTNGRFVSKETFDALQQQEFSMSKTNSNPRLEPVTLAAIEAITSALGNKLTEQLEACFAALSSPAPTNRETPSPQTPHVPQPPSNTSLTLSPLDTTQTPAHSTTGITSNIQLGFIPPLSGNTANGTSEPLSFDHPFPHVEEATITSILAHTFNPYHLWKLDPRYHK
jgi:hypothetical protein